MSGFRRRGRGVSLFAKLLVPFLILILVVGVGGAFLIVRDLSSRAQASLDRDLLRDSLDARSIVRDRELYLLESVNFAANLAGTAEAVAKRDAPAEARLLRSVPALKTDLSLVVATTRDGRGLVEYVRARPGGSPSRSSGTAWARMGFVRRALGDRRGSRHVGLVRFRGAALLGVAAPICTRLAPCRPVGAAVVATGVDALAREAAGRPSSAQTRFGVAIYDNRGRALAASGLTGSGPAPPASPRPVRRTETVRGAELASLFVPLELGAERIGTLAVRIPTAPALSPARSAALRLAFLLSLAIAGIVATGALVTRYLLRQVRALLETSTAIGHGDLSVRAPVVARDELGRLASVMNDMADQLQASYGTLEARVDERTEEVRRLLRERTEFFAGISHELRTPIAVILSQATMALDPRYPKRGRLGAEAAETIRQSAEQLLTLVNDILDLARAESGGIEVSLEDVPVQRVVEESRRTVEGLAAAARLTVRIDVPRTLPPARADAARLRQVLLNLVDNAVKYTPPGGTVTLAATEREGAVALSVSDTGIGIPAEEQERIFDPFYRVPGTRAHRGRESSGLGLALVKRFVVAQGGEIAISSEPGRGSTFTVTLPRATVRKARPTRARRTLQGAKIGDDGQHAPVVVGRRL